MGINASVMCTCFKEGKVKPPPFLEYVKIDNEGYLNLDLPYEGNETEHATFSEWFENACEHPEMGLVSEYISNWGGYRLFQQALAESGWHHYPTLKTELPEANGGLTAPTAAAKMLEELEFFSQQIDLGWKIVLIDSSTGNELYEHIPAYGGKFIFSKTGIDIGIDEQGVFIHQRTNSQVFEVFRSLRFEQQLLEPELTETYKGGLVEYIDLESGAKFQCTTAIPGDLISWPDGQMENEKGQVRMSYPRWMHIEKRKRISSEFEDILASLRSVCKAAVEANNPIRWG